MRVTSTRTLLNWLAIVCVWNGVELLRQAGAVAVRFICRVSDLRVMELFIFMQLCISDIFVVYRNTSIPRAAEHLMF